MDLGAFSISLAVKDIQKSISFYAELGFEFMGGEPEQGWAILKNRQHIIGLFEGMFEKNMLTFNPGWDQDAHNIDPFCDVREVKAKLEAAGIAILKDDITTDEGPASFVVEDPDGNPILIDQHRK